MKSKRVATRRQKEVAKRRRRMRRARTPRAPVWWTAKARGWVPVHKADIPLIKQAGGAVIDYRSQDVPAVRAYWSTPLMRSVILAVRAVAAQQGLPAADLVEAINKGGGFLPGFHFNAALAAALLQPVEFGPVRANPDGTFDIKGLRPDGGWSPATDALLRELDAEVRLTGVKSLSQEAASMVLAYKEGKAP